jgi:hypothetical protein
MIREAIEQNLISAGWEVDGGFSEHLLIGNAGELSILIPWWARRDAEDAEYELYDAQKNRVCRIEAVPTPLQARMLLEEHGESAFLQEGVEEE